MNYNQEPNIVHSMESRYSEEPMGKIFDELRLQMSLMRAFQSKDPLKSDNQQGNVSDAVLIDETEKYIERGYTGELFYDNLDKISTPMLAVFTPIPARTKENFTRLSECVNGNIPFIFLSQQKPIMGNEDFDVLSLFREKNPNHPYIANFSDFFGANVTTKRESSFRIIEYLGEEYVLDKNTVQYFTHIDSDVSPFPSLEKLLQLAENVFEQNESVGSVAFPVKSQNGKIVKPKDFDSRDFINGQGCLLSSYGIPGCMAILKRKTFYPLLKQGIGPFPLKQDLYGEWVFASAVRNSLGECGAYIHKDLWESCFVVNFPDAVNLDARLHKHVSSEMAARVIHAHYNILRVFGGLESQSAIQITEEICNLPLEQSIPSSKQYPWISHFREVHGTKYVREKALQKIQKDALPEVLTKFRKAVSLYDPITNAYREALKRAVKETNTEIVMPFSFPKKRNEN